MKDDQELDRGLSADLAALRSTLRELHAPGADERTLIAALRTRRAAAGALDVPPDQVPAAAARTRHAAHVRAWRALAAAAALAAVTAVLTLRVERGGDVAPADSPASQVASTAAPAPALASAFQPLAFSPGLSASQSYSVVRVRIPLTALTPGHSAPPDATIEADLLVGEDGLASGIRFNRADTLFVSTVSNEIGERR